MSEDRMLGKVKVVARSTGRYPVLIVEAGAGRFLATHFETDYDLGAGKPVGEDWITDNAIGRHSFVAVEPPEELEAGDLTRYAGETS